jgi:hypothetical protein
MIYLLREKDPPHQLLIGTEHEIPVVLDGPDDHEKTFLNVKNDRFGLLDGLPRGPARPGKKSRERGDYEGVFDIRQMEGDKAASRALRLRFTPEGKYDPGDEPHVFLDAAALDAFIATGAVHVIVDTAAPSALLAPAAAAALLAFFYQQERWTKQDERALGQRRKTVAEQAADRTAPIAQGLAGRLPRRPR